MRRSRSDRWRFPAWTPPRARASLLPLLLATLLTPPPELRAQEETVGARECCLEILVPVGARLIGMGQAMTARSGPGSVFANPAGLASLASVEGRHLMVHAAELPGDSEESRSQLLGLSLLLTPWSLGTVGLSYRLMDFGEIVATGESESVVVGRLGIRNHVVAASFATDVVQGLSAGLSYKFYLFRTHCTGNCAGLPGSSSTQLMDVGLQYRPPTVPTLSAGVSVRDLGLALQAVNAEQADPTPVRVRLGGALDVAPYFTADTTLAGWVSLDLEIPPRAAAESTLHVGVEVAIGGLVFLRAGYAPGQGIGTGPALGLGLHYENFILDVARTFRSAPLAGDDPPLDLTFGIRF